MKLDWKTNYSEFWGQDIEYAENELAFFSIRHSHTANEYRLFVGAKLEKLSLLEELQGLGLEATFDGYRDMEGGISKFSWSRAEVLAVKNQAERINVLILNDLKNLKVVA